MSTWRPARQGLAVAGLLVAALTSVFLVWLGETGWHVLGAWTYLMIAALAVLSPAGIAVQVVWGQALVGSLLVAPGGPSALWLGPGVAGVILTAELLAAVARMDTPIESDPRDDLPRAVTAALIGVAVFGAVTLAGAIPGPTGLAAIVLAAGACAVLGALLAGDHLFELRRPPERTTQD
jgi:hypothetical protein